MSPINRLQASNGRTTVPKSPVPHDQPGDQRLVAGFSAADELKKVILAHPGALLLVGLAVGGLLGWLTLRRNR